MDVTDTERVKTVIERENPDVIIHSAALVGAVPCEKDPALAWMVNTHGTANIVRACQNSDRLIVFVSTAAVFDGKQGNYSEATVPSPSYLYAYTKLAAESIIQTHSRFLIIRTDFFDPGHFKYQKVFIDHYTTKEPLEETAKKIRLIVNAGAEGIYHIGGRKDSLYNILKPFFPNIEPISIVDSPLPRFPRDISLDTSKFAQLLNEHPYTAT